MKQSLFLLSTFLLATLSSCEAIGSIFKAGVWVGILIVAAVIGVIVFIFSRASKK
ncbi:MAG: phosphatidate cytidylyltransferase [Ferruginibacter sp.]